VTLKAYDFRILIKQKIEETRLRGDWYILLTPPNKRFLNKTTQELKEQTANVLQPHPSANESEEEEALIQLPESVAVYCCRPLPMFQYYILESVAV
jgi:hypothetical protein